MKNTGGPRAALAVIGLFAIGVGLQPDANAQVPPPTPSPGATAPPLPTASPPAGRGRRRGSDTTAKPSGAPEPSASPTSPAFSTLDGSWEVQTQYRDRTTYSHFTLRQQGNAVGGTWSIDGQKVPVDGTYDGRLIKLSAKRAAGEFTFSGYVEGATDMVGLIENAGSKVAFTASHRSPLRAPLKRGR